MEVLFCSSHKDFFTYQCPRMDGVSLPDSIEFITFGECALAATATSESEGPIFFGGHKCRDRLDMDWPSKRAEVLISC